jgi:tetratricopeptide (TPR) repeat protein
MKIRSLRSCASSDARSGSSSCAAGTPNTPTTALVAVNAVLSENQGDLEAAAAGYADAAQRWQAFGAVPEQAFALLGQGRCLTRLGRTSEATPVLQQAREIFTRLQAAPALAETDQLLRQATALSS